MCRFYVCMSGGLVVSRAGIYLGLRLLSVNFELSQDLSKFRPENTWQVLVRIWSNLFPDKILILVSEPIYLSRQLWSKL